MVQSEQHVIHVYRLTAGGVREAQANMEETDGERVQAQARSTLRSGVRSAMRAASQLHGRGPTDVDDAPAPKI